ncbi:uncharacterized protein LOC142590654 isoform X1 [Dermacentor variabilis]|uniref:uncharacterized protein LOC142590654 isoform X1 n=1 Tax=Dermacentor variabilis TaxID=34621 RepID=UPI003F5C25F3
MLEENMKAPRCAVCGLRSAANAVLLPLPDLRTHAEVYHAWIDFVRGCPDKAYWEPDSHTGFVCTLHFTSNWLRRIGGKFLSARAGAVPTLYPSREQLRRIAEANSVVAAAAQGRQEEVEALGPGVVATQCNVKVAVKSTCCTIKVMSKLLQCTVELVSQGTQVFGLDDIDGAEQQMQYCVKRKGGAAVYGGRRTSVKMACSEVVVVKKEPMWMTTEAAEIHLDVQDDIEEYLVEKTSPLTEPNAPSGSANFFVASRIAIGNERSTSDLCSRKPDVSNSSTADDVDADDGGVGCCRGLSSGIRGASTLREKLQWNHGSKKGNYRCALCSYSTNHKKRLSKHSQRHTMTDTLLECEKCFRTFSYESHLALHMRAHEHPHESAVAGTSHGAAQEKPFKCENCSHGFSSETKLVKHTRIHENPALCPVCSRAFEDEDRMKVHLRRHTGEKPFQCELCPKAYTARRYLRQHMRGHPKSSECRLCPKTSSWEDGPAKRACRHTCEKRYRCELCGRMFANYSYLSQHRITHRKYFRCTVCSRAFCRKTALVVHMRQHTGEMPFKCQECLRKFSTMPSLKRHTICHEKPFKCSLCPTAYTNEKRLSNHLRAHSENRLFECRICPCTFTKRNGLNRHLCTHENDGSGRSLSAPTSGCVPGADQFAC